MDVFFFVLFFVCFFLCSVFFNMKVFCVFSLESPQQGDSNEYTQHTIINI